MFTWLKRLFGIRAVTATPEEIQFGFPCCNGCCIWQLDVDPRCINKLCSRHCDVNCMCCMKLDIQRRITAEKRLRNPRYTEEYYVYRDGRYHQVTKP